MILDSLENRARYYALNPRLEKAFDYLLSTDLGAFDVQKDIRFYDDVPLTYYEVTPGQFTLLFPEDAHAPMVGEGTIRKVIVKVRV